MSDLVPSPNRALESLTDRERSFVICYVESGYNMSATARESGITTDQAKKMMAVPSVRKAILEVQEDIDSIDFLNEKWVKAQILRLFPMVMGDEDTPALDSRGGQVFVKQFSPSVAMKILEYVAPKKASGVSVTVNTGAEFNSMTDEQLEEFIEAKLHTFPMKGTGNEIPEDPESAPEAPQEALPEVTWGGNK